MNNNQKALIQYLYLDLSTCDRCVGTDDVLSEVLDVLEPTLQLAGYDLERKKVEMSTSGIATEYRFLSSPTIRVNDIDICLAVEENDCGCCSDIAGCVVECRVFRYEDEIYEIPPKEMLAKAILTTLFSDNTDIISAEYTMPENLENFYLNKNKNETFIMKRMSIYEPAMCCDTGLCGSSVDPELLRISGVLSSLKKNGVVVDRFNLTSAPMVFVNNQVIHAFMNKGGVDKLPVVMLDDQIIITGRYPTNEELVSLLGVTEGYLTESKTQSNSQDSCGCSSEDCC